MALAGLSPTIIALLGRSEVMHLGVEASNCTTLADAIVGLPGFDAADVQHLLAPLAETDDVDCPPPFTLASGNCASLLLLAPMYPSLRTLSVRDATRAWVLVDMLCLNAARRIEDDLVQRYAENPSAEADWRAALTVAGCPACDTLWERVAYMFAALRIQWGISASCPIKFGAVPTVGEEAGRLAWQRDLSIHLFTSLGQQSVSIALVGACVAPAILATLRHNANERVAKAAFQLLVRIGCPELYLKAYATALARCSADSDSVDASIFALLRATTGDANVTAMVAAGIVPLLFDLLCTYYDDKIGNAVLFYTPSLLSAIFTIVEKSNGDTEPLISAALAAISRH